MSWLNLISLAIAVASLAFAWGSLRHAQGAAIDATNRERDRLRQIIREEIDADRAKLASHRCAVADADARRSLADLIAGKSERIEFPPLAFTPEQEARLREILREEVCHGVLAPIVTPAFDELVLRPASKNPPRDGGLLE